MSLMQKNRPRHALDGGEAHQNTPEFRRLRSIDPIHELRRAAVKQVLGSTSFSKATRLATFLEYVCRLTLEGRKDEINELNIGKHVFERRDNYNAAEDTIVRTTARLLRQRLKLYYDGEGKADPIRIDIPRGGYVPTFVEAVAPVALPEVSNTDLSPQPTKEDLSRLNAHRSRRGTLQVLIGMALGIFIGSPFAMVFLSRYQRPQWSMKPSERLWSALFSKQRDTILVPADTVLLIYETSTHKLVSLDEYLDGHFATPEEVGSPQLQYLFHNYHKKRYTAVTSVAMAAKFGQLQQEVPERFQVRFTRDLRLADLKTSNAILLGAAQNNPWVGVFRKSLNFHLDWKADTNSWNIVNDHPLAGEFSAVTMGAFPK